MTISIEPLKKAFLSLETLPDFLQMSLKQLANLREDFSESDLPIRIDIVDGATVTPEFKTIIQTTASKLI